VGDRAHIHQLLDQILDSQRLSNHGPMVHEFERRLCEITGARHAIATCNATLALQLTLLATARQREVIVPSFTFAATVHAISMAGLQPVFADIDPATHALSPVDVQQKITPATGAILATHLWGQCADVEMLEEISHHHQLPLIFDAAHALGSFADGRMVGRFGTAEVFSMHATKIVNCFEGGVVTTDDDDLAERLKRLRNFGFVGVDRVISVGTNAKMHEMSAAMGLDSLDHLPEYIAANRRNYLAYEKSLREVPGVELLSFQLHPQCNHQYVVVEIDGTKTGLRRDILLQILQAENIVARRYFFPGCHRMPPYRTLPSSAPENLPWTERLTDRVLVLPTGPSVSEEQIEVICSIIRLATTCAAQFEDAAA
jgi:dTDP-4-amino-4,6-dideoxygalactose transaminase